MSGGGGTTTVQNKEPWAAQKPYLETGFQQAQKNVLNRPREYFPDSTVVPFSPETTAAMGAQGNRARAGSPLLGGAQSYTGDVLGGKYLSPESNPFLSGVQDSVMAQVRPGVDATFARAGRGGSPIHAEALGRGVSRGMAPYLFGEYGRERGAMEAAAGRAPGLAREDYFDIGQLADVGAQRESKAGEGLQDQISRWNFGQQEAANRIGDYMGLIGGGYRGGYGTTTSSTSTRTNPALLGLGAAGGMSRLMGK